MRSHLVALMLALTVGVGLLPAVAHAGLKRATLDVKGMVCQA
jgi:hypothetical protein